ncbi:2Fe-2S iron-sulfur cluster-binding protein [Sinosporangium siamense]|uniref:2Fe-2S iron-sulfur cluster-binding protein n=1 Tax=Sinosporangium siamense TaxID=1367973 RepID=UPI0035E8218D
MAGRSAEADLAAAAADRRTEAYLCGRDGFVKEMCGGLPEEADVDEPFFSQAWCRLRSARRPRRDRSRCGSNRSGAGTTWTAEDGSLLEIGRSAGVGLPSSCRAGACGTCRQRVAGEAAHLIEPAMPLAAGRVLLCCAVPVSDVTVDA